LISFSLKYQAVAYMLEEIKNAFDECYTFLILIVEEHFKFIFLSSFFILTYLWEIMVNIGLFTFFGLVYWVYQGLRRVFLLSVFNTVKN